MFETRLGKLFYEVGYKVDATIPPAELAKVNKALDAIGREQAKLRTSTTGADQASKPMGLTIAGLTATMGAAVLQAIKLSDSFTRLNGKLKLATKDATELATAQRELYRIAQQSAQSYESVSDLYVTLSHAAKELGATQSQLISFTEGVGNALRIQGITSAEASGALTQLGQALGGGTVRAEEFNSVLEQAPRLLQTVADNTEGANGSIGKLRKLVIDGKLSSKEFFDAFLRGSAQLQAEAARIPETVETGLTRLKNTVFTLVGQFDEAAGATATLAKVLSELSKQTDDNASAASKLGTAFANNGEIVRGFAKILFSLQTGTGSLRDGLDDVTSGFKRLIGVAKQLEGVTLPSLTTQNTRGTTIADFVGTRAPIKITANTPEVDKRLAKASADALADVRKELDGLQKSFNNDGPVAQFRARIAEFTAAAKLAKLPTKELDAALVSLSAMLEEVKRTAAKDAAQELERLAASMSVTAADDLTHAYREQVAELRKKADAQLKDADGSGELAQRYYDSAQALEEQGRQLAIVTGALEDLAAAREKVARQPEGVFSAELVNQRDNLVAIRAQLTDKKAIALITAEIDRLERDTSETQRGSATATGKTLSQTVAIASALEDAARFALGLEQAFGNVNSRIARTLTGVLQVTGAIRSLGDKADAAGGFDKLFSSTDGIVSAIPVIGSLISAVVSLTKESPESKQAKAIAKANTEALDRLTNRIGDLASANISANDYIGARRAVTGLLDTPSGRNSLDRRTRNAPFRDIAGTRRVDGSNFYSAEGLTTADIERIASELGVTFDGTVQSLKDLEAALTKVDFSAMTTSVNGLQSLFALLAKLDGAEGGERALADLKEIIARLGSPELREQLATFDTATEEGRQALRDFLNGFVRKLVAGDESAFLQLGDLKIADFLQLVSQLVTGIDDLTSGVAAGVDTLTPALQRLDERIKLFGLSAAQVLDATLAAYGNAFPALQNLFQGLDLTSKEGTDAALKRLQELYAALASDGIDAGEQKLVDAILAIAESLGEAAGDILTLAERLAQRGQAIANGFSKFTTQIADYQKFNTAFGAKANPLQAIGGLIAAGINAGADVPAGVGDSNYIPSTRAGLLAYRDTVSAKFNQLNADGVIDEAERATVDILSALLDAIDAGIQSFDDDAATVTANAQDAVARRLSDQGILDRALGTDNAQALVNKAQAIGGALGAALDSVTDVQAGSIEATTHALQKLLREAINGELPFEALGDATRDTFVSTVLELLNGVRDISAEFSSAADKLKADAQDLAELNFDLQDAQGGDSRLGRLLNSRATQRAQFEASGKDAEFLSAFDKLTDILRSNLQKEIAAESAPPVSSANTISADTRSQSFTTTTASLAGANVPGILQSQLLVLRNVEKILASAFRGTLIPALPAGTGGFVGKGESLTLNFSGDVYLGNKPLGTLDKEQLARDLTPLISNNMNRTHTSIVRRTGGSLR